MSIGNAIFQGIVQGLTEFLPVSSSGHLSLIQYFTGQSGDSGIFFSILLHLGTLLAVIIAFRGTIRELILEVITMLRDIFTGKFTIRYATPQRRMLLLLIVSLCPMIITVFLRDWFASLSTDNYILAEGLCFVLTSALLMASAKSVAGHKDSSTMLYRDALGVGLAQAFAPLPGLSRSGSTISIGVLMGLDRKYAVAFSFIMGIPAVLGANVLEIGDAMRQGVDIPAASLAAGLIASFAFGLLAIKMVNLLVTSDKFKYFAWYTLALGSLTIVASLVEKISDHAIQRWVMSMMG